MERSSFERNSRALNVHPEDDAPLRINRCENCNAFQPPEGSVTMGSCRASLPVAYPIPGGISGQIGAVGLWPPVKPTDWCRHWGQGIPEKSPQLPLSTEPYLNDPSL